MTEDLTTYDLWSLEPRSGRAKGRAADPSARSDLPQWSPSGDRLAFVGVAQTSELYQTNPVDGQARVLSSPGGSNVLDFDFISVGS